VEQIFHINTINTMYYIYAIVNNINNDLYIGYSEDLRQRIQEHNNGLVQSTKNKKPWKLIYYEAYNNKGLALRQEKRLKMHAVKNELKRRLGLI